MIANTTARRRGIAPLALALSLLLACLAGCAQQEQGTSSSPAGTAGQTEAPAPTAEIADVTTVAYLGPEGTYTEEVAKLFFGDNDELAPQATVADALARVADGSVAYAVIPQENTLGGPVTDYIDAFLAAEDVSVVGEVVLPIRQTLMGLPGTDLSKVTRVLSHKQGLAQSSAWLDENLPGAERVEAASTAAAAQEVASGNDPTVVAIAAPGAAKLYGLDVLQENVSQSEANKTRFYVVSRTPNKLPGYRSAVFVANLSADQLPGALDAACSNGATLVSVHDRPEKSALGVYRYVIELEHAGGFTDEEIARIEDATQLECLGRCTRVEG
jgi:prephenate dehydratase/chorismate mutase/prephenate dehydratase